jgi:hypothetical protein
MIDGCGCDADAGLSLSRLTLAQDADISIRQMSILNSALQLHTGRPTPLLTIVYILDFFFTWQVSCYRNGSNNIGVLCSRSSLGRC